MWQLLFISKKLNSSFLVTFFNLSADVLIIGIRFIFVEPSGEYCNSPFVKKLFTIVKSVSS
jgi:hypothetical protein